MLTPFGTLLPQTSKIVAVTSSTPSRACPGSSNSTWPAAPS